MMNILRLRAIFLVLSLFLITPLLGQEFEMTGASQPNTTELSYTYSFTSDQSTLLPGGWLIVGPATGTIISQTTTLLSVGYKYTVNIKFNTPGNGAVRFARTSPSGTTIYAIMQINVVDLPAAPPTLTALQLCGSVRVDLPTPPSGVSYYWQTSPTGTSISDAASFKEVTIAGTTLYLRSKLNSSNNWSATSSSITPTIDPKPSGTISGPAAKYYGSASGQMQCTLANGAGSVIKWQRRPTFPADGTWVDISGSAGLSTLNFAAVEETTEFRAVLTNGTTCTDEPSSPFTVNVEQANFTGRISGTHVLFGTNNSGSLVLNGHTGAIESWEYSASGLSWQTVSIGSSNTLTLSNIGSERYYRVKVSKAGVVAYSPVHVVMWSPAPAASLVTNNAIIVESLRIPETIEANLAAMNSSQKSVAYAYTDGLDRVVQTVMKNVSSTQKDLVNFSVYDELGRQQRTYLPYTATGSNYYTTPVTDQAAFYNGTSKVAIDAYPFADVVFDGSPLNRVIEQGSAGAQGQIAQHHTLRSITRTNVANEIRIWKTNATSPGYYAAGTLNVTEITDQNDNKVITFSDNRGLLLEKHVQSTATIWLKTLYIYDVSGRIRYVLQPEGVRLTGTAATIWATNLTRFAFQYTYDSKGRVAEKLVPGATAPAYVVYDPLDRPVLAQDGNLRASNKWAFIKFDGNGRPVMQGLYTNATQTTQSAMQTLLDGLYATGNTDYPANAWFEERGTTLHGYSNVSFPKVNAGGTPVEVLSVNFYDSYDFDDADTAPDFAYTAQGMDGEGTAVDAYALPTGSKQLVLGTSNWLYSYVFYDKYGRVIQSRTNNHLNAAVDNLVTTVYDFEGKALITKNYHHAGAAGQTTVINKYQYDDSGHLIKVYQNNNSAPTDQLVAQYEYNELGQVVDKKLHNTTGTDFLQSVDYRYDIRGSLSSINNAQLDVNATTNDDTNDYFGMEFLYDVNEPLLGNTRQYNGNVSAIKWKGIGAVSGATDKKAYVYEYDNADRLLTATSKNFSGTSWNREVGVHNEVMTYDYNGNIKTLKRYQRKYQLTGVTASYVYELIDNLTYTYGGNIMTKVDDAITYTAGQTGFNNGSAAATEYTYNTAGSLTADANKGISSITYNDLGKPTVILFADLRKVEYTYDAAGNKLTVKDYAAGAATPQTTTDYVGSFVYENGVLTLFGSPEGRVVNKGGTLEYQYNLADHQGNTRVVFSSATPAPDAPVASFEGDANDKASEYGNISPGNVVSFASANHTTGGIKVLRMNQTTKIAATKSLHVYPGDKVDLEVWEYHEGSSGFGTTSTPASTLVTMLAGAFATGVPAVDAQITSGVNTGVGAWGPGGGNQGDARPAAYLNYILFDKNYNVLTMGWQLAPDATFTKQKLSFSTINIKAEGYLFAYLSYDGDSNNWVYFDDLKVTHTKTNVIQYNEYYPFGLQAGTSWTRDDSKNNFLYNEGGELNATTGVYDLFYRNYDPVLGRLTQVDPMAEKYAALSPYNYSGNSPIANNDPLGDDWYDDYMADTYRGIPYNGPFDDGRGGGNNSNSSGWGNFGYGDGAMQAYSSYGMSPAGVRVLAKLAGMGAHFSLGNHTDYSRAIAAGNMILGEEAAGKAARNAVREEARRAGISISSMGDVEFKNGGFYVSYKYGISGFEDGLFFAGVASASAFVPYQQAPQGERASTSAYTLRGDFVSHRDLLAEFMTGTGPARSLFNDGHPLTIAMQKSMIVLNAKMFYLQAYPNGGDMFQQHIDFSVGDVFFAVSQIEQFIGSARVSIVPRGNKTYYVIDNTTSRHSGSYDTAPNVDRTPGQITPMGNIYQRFIWVEEN